MRSGRVAQRKIVLQDLGQGSPRQSSSGERQDPWTTFATVRGYIRPISGKEMREAGQTQEAIDTEIEIRHLDAVTARRGKPMRATHLGVVYTIHAVIDPEARQKKLLLQCSSGVVNEAARA
jgi:SPP1 family predicted phage head-tail adaptor